MIKVPRKRRKCRVELLPPATYYKPAGVPLRELEEVALSVEEFEALRLKDMEGLEQIDCAERMGVARTTYQRILYAAREKVAGALVEGKAIRIEGGRYVLSGHSYRCTRCGREFEKPCSNSLEGTFCPECGKGDDCIEPVRKGQRRQQGFGGGCRQYGGNAHKNQGKEPRAAGMPDEINDKDEENEK